jgi:serine/threonine protein kinase
MGTVSYMSPEQSLALKTLDYRTDIWSLGVVLYEMFTGHLPFEGKSLYEQIVAIQERPHLPLATFDEHVPKRLEEIVSKALAKNPDDRYQTANDFLVDLRNLKRTLEVDASNNRTALFDQRAGTTGSSESSPRSFSGNSSSSAEYIVNQVKLHDALRWLCLECWLAAVLAFVWYLKRSHAALLTDKDTILLAEFENKTGEDVSTVP